MNFFVFIWITEYEDIQQKRYPPKKFLETLELALPARISRKRGRFTKIGDRPSCNVTGRVNIPSLFPWKFRPREQIHGCKGAEVGTCGATMSLAIALAPQLFLNGCADACAASIFAIVSAIASQIRL